MPYELLYNRLPKIAERETRSIIITEDSDLGSPAGQYGFLEMFRKKIDGSKRKFKSYDRKRRRKVNR